MKKPISLWYVAVLGLSLPCVAQAAPVAPTNLRTEMLVQPLGLDTVKPRFSWQVRDAAAGARQTAYQVQAASTAERLPHADMWDSRRTASDQSHLVPYSGKPLAARQRVWWRVRVWDANGAEGAWSEPSWFETGLLDAPAWQAAAWIGCNRDHEAPEPAPAELMGPWITAADAKPIVSFCKDIALPDKPIVSAMAYWGLSKVSGPASVVVNYEALQGYRRSPMDRVMRPRDGGFADMAFYLLPGKSNRIEVRFARAARNIAATVGMRIVFADGAEMTVASGPDWQVHPAGPKQASQPAKVAEAYGGPKYGVARQLPQTSLPPAWFRTRLNVCDGLKRARLYLCALGQGQSYVNGAPVDDSLLSPPQSDYEEFAFYTTHDITGLLIPGANALSVLLDGGWYHEVGGFSAVFSYGRPGLKALVVLDYGHGKTEQFSSGPEWEWREGAIRSANIYRGDRVDFRRDHLEWKTPNASTGWQRAQVIPPRTPKTIAADIVPVRRDGQLKPVKRWRIGSRTWLFDVGEMIHGWVRFTVAEPAGNTVRLRYSEYAKDGVLENVPGSQWWCHGVTQGDEIICDGTSRVFEPLFTPKSFRFVEISGVGREPADLVAVPVHTAAPALATFESSDPMLNRLFANGMRTFRNYMNNMLGDIPRERDLWGAESIYSAVPGVYCYDWAPNHRLMNRLWWTGPMAPGGIPGNIGVGKRLTTATRGFIWSVTPVFITSELYEHYADMAPARAFYDKMRHLLRYAERTGENGGTIPVPHDLSDHAPPRDIPRKPANGALISALVFFEAQNRFARMADALGKAEDAAYARAHAEKVRTAIMTFYDAKKRTFGNGTHDSLALAYGAVTDAAERRAVAASLAGYYRANGHQFDGGFMSYEVYPQLSKYGYVDDAVKMLVNTEPPGPARSVKVYDATSFWEAYYLDHDFQMFRGLNFIAFGHSVGWMITDLAGIRFDPSVPGCRRLILAPAFPSGGVLDRAKASLETLYGKAESTWTRNADGSIRWTATVPWNTVATVRLPGFAADRVTVNGQPFKDAKLNVTSAQPFEFEVTAGIWDFTIQAVPNNP